MFRLYGAPWRFRQVLMGPVFALAVLAVGDAGARTYVTADGKLEQHDLPNDESSLLQYLEQGIPERATLHFQRRWEVYGAVAAKLGELKSNTAVPVLVGLLADPLPPALENDLLLASIGGTWEDWDGNRAGNLAVFRAECAMALAHIGNKHGRLAVEGYGAALRDTVIANVDNNRWGNQLLASYGRVCRAITAMGGKTGIDAMIAFLDHLPAEGPELLVWHLQLCTGQFYGPEWTLPRHRWPEETAKWKRWWSENRDSFKVDQEFVLNARSLDMPPPNPQSLREHLVVAATRYMDFDGKGYGKRSAAWLDKNCKKYQAELSALVNDENEDAAVRKEAMSWYVPAMDTWGNWASGESALDLLTDFATGNTADGKGVDAAAPSQNFEWLLQSAALKLIEEHFPDAIDGVARQCIQSDAVASNAVYILMSKEENLAFITEHFDEIALPGQGQALQRFLQAPDPVGRTVFIDGVKSTNVGRAMYATLGIEKFGLEDDLPPENREALDRWREDPEFQLFLLERGPSTEEIAPAVQSIVREIEDSNAEAAATYRRCYYLLPEGERDVAMEGLLRCVAAYKTSRGL